jgi:hypothetical protein
MRTHGDCCDSDNVLGNNSLLMYNLCSAHVTINSRDYKVGGCMESNGAPRAMRLAPMGFRGHAVHTA